MALCLSDNDRKHEALKYGERANNLLYELNHNSFYIKSFVELARFYFEADKCETAIEIGEQACSLTLNLYGDNSNEYASSLSNLAYYYHENNNITKAIELENKALYTCRNNKNQDGIAESLGHLGKYYYRLEQYEIAIKFYEESSRILKNIKGYSQITGKEK